LENLDIPINNKWLDVGCGNGSIANAVNSKRFSSNLWKIHGCDLQENRIKIAQNNARKMRYFYQENVLDRLQKNSHATNQYDIISMFEFCEHFVDPYSLLAEMSKKQFKLIVIATPLEQKFTSNADTEPDPAHLWSFSAQAWIKMLSKLNLKTIYHSEISVGQHTKGLNWLTVVAAKPQVYDLVNSI
ncbi:MAG: class I SAM-dependent methyltransferase, partial [Marinicella sp.]